VTTSRGAAAPWFAREATGLLALTALVVVCVGVVPLGRLVLAVVGDAPLSAFEGFWQVLEAPRTRRAIANTLIVAVASAALTLLLGVAVVLLAGCTDLAGKRGFAIMFVLSLLIAPQVAALAYKTLAGPASPLLGALGLAPAPGTPNPMLSLGGIILVLGLHHAPLAAVTIAPGLRRIPRETIEAARIDGASSPAIVWRIVLPLLAPNIAAAAMLVMVAGLGNFGIPALLGLPAGIVTLPTLVYRSLSTAGPAALVDAARLSLLIAAVTAIGIALAAIAQRRADRIVAGDQPFEAFWTLGVWRWPVTLTAWLGLVLIVVVPLLSLIATALVPTYGVPLTAETITLDRFVEVLMRQSVTRRAFITSFALAGTAAVILALLAVPLAYILVRRAPRWRPTALALVELPYAVPGVVVAIVCILLFLRPLPIIGVSLYATPWIILIAYLIRFLALALKPTLAVMATLPLDTEEAAALSGARLGARLRHVVGPALLPAATAGGLIVFLLAFNELTVSALLWSAGTETLGVALLSLEDAGLGAEAAAVGVAVTVIVTLVVLALDLARDRLPPDTLPWTTLAGR
jgi:iron(III) transport system permease protein